VRGRRALISSGVMETQNRGKTAECAETIS
jgi:hypothetical protein